MMVFCFMEVNEHHPELSHNDSCSKGDSVTKEVVESSIVKNGVDVSSNCSKLWI